jgi:peptidoglycan/xylan/chitin deacetylase (PgdA/CDA1 family)
VTLFALCAAAALALLCAAPMIARWFQQRSLSALCVRRRALVLTYDDGPGARSTPALLDVLDRHGARATFFALGVRAEEGRATLDRAAAAGHEIGCHSYAHVHAWKSWPWSSLRDVERGYGSLAAWVRHDGPFRPPYGKLTPVTWFAARLRGRRLSWWTIVSGDTRDDLPDPASVVSEVRRRNGGVVLLHDFDRDDARTGYMLELTAQLLLMAKESGLRVTTMGDLLQDSGDTGGADAHAV